MATAEVNSLVAAEIERRINAGELSRDNALDVNWLVWKKAMLAGAVGAAPAKSRAGKGFPKPYFNAEILRLHRERVRVLVEIKVLEREGGDTSDLWAEFRALRAKAKRESRRAKAAYWKSRNQKLTEIARDPTRSKESWNVLLQRAASDCASAIELYSFRARWRFQENVDSPQHVQLGREGAFRLAGIFAQSVPRVSPGRAEVEDEVSIGLPRPPELELPNAARP